MKVLIALCYVAAQFLIHYPVNQYEQGTNAVYSSFFIPGLITGYWSDFPFEQPGINQSSHYSCFRPSFRPSVPPKFVSSYNSNQQYKYFFHFLFWNYTFAMCGFEFFLSPFAELSVAINRGVSFVCAYGRDLASLGFEPRTPKGRVIAMADHSN